MIETRAAIAAFAGATLLLLSGCGEDQSTVTTAPEPQEPVEQESAEPAGEPDAMEQLRESAGQLAREGERMAGEARQRAERALEDAGPLLEQAGEIAGRIGQSVEEIVQQATEDLQRGVEMLEERIAEMSGEPAIVVDSDARLAPEADLNADTSAAARAVQAGVGPDYVGVWADTAENCGRIDQDYVERFAVITPTTIRHVETVCNFEATSMENGEATIAAECVAEGDLEQRNITLSMADFETLRISYDGHAGSAFLRCHLPE